VKLTTHPQYVFMAWCLVKHRDKFTVTLASRIQLWNELSSIPLKIVNVPPVTSTCRRSDVQTCSKTNRACYPLSTKDISPSVEAAGTWSWLPVYV